MRSASSGLIRSSSDETRALVNAAGELASDAAARIRVFADEDETLVLGPDGIPAVEQAARDYIESRITGELMSGGDDFEVNLLLSQERSMRYVAALATQVAELEDDADRSAWLVSLAERAEGLRVSLRDRLTVRGGP